MTTKPPKLPRKPLMTRPEHVITVECTTSITLPFPEAARLGRELTANAARADAPGFVGLYFSRDEDGQIHCGVTHWVSE
jgi:hypothetical protein